MRTRSPTRKWYSCECMIPIIGTRKSSAQQSIAEISTGNFPKEKHSRDDPGLRQHADQRGFALAHRPVVVPGEQRLEDRRTDAQHPFVGPHAPVEREMRAVAIAAESPESFAVEIARGPQ